MRTRKELQTILEEILGSKYVYFQPPASVKLHYPCILYRLNNEDSQFADNHPYIKARRYQVTVIDQNPDTEILGRVTSLPMCIFDRHYTADHLNHYVLNLYF